MNRQFRVTVKQMIETTMLLWASDGAEAHDLAISDHGHVKRKVAKQTHDIYVDQIESVKEKEG